MSDHPEREPTQAEQEKWLAEAERARAEARKATAEAERAEALAEQAMIDLERERSKRSRELADDDHYHVYRFTNVVAEQSVAACVARLAAWQRTEPGCDITIIFDSPGGSVIDGFALFDCIQELRAAGHHVTTKALGYAASMAGILLQAGDTRVMAAQSWLMIHEAAFGVIDKTSEVEDRVKWVKRIQDRTTRIFLDRADAALAAREEAGEKLRRGQRLTPAQFRNRWHRKDWWLSSDDALYHGLIDRVDGALEAEDAGSR